jgi:large subunit ribosomal protein L27
MAHKKAGGSTSLGRDSVSKRLGVKVFGDQRVNKGEIIIRQHGTKFYPGKNVRLADDSTLYSAIDGVVKFKKKMITKFHGGLRRTRVVSVEAVAAVAAPAKSAPTKAKIATATKKVTSPAAKK